MKSFAEGFFEGEGAGVSIARGLFRGVGIGIGLAFAFFAAALALELLNCATGGYFQNMPAGSVAGARENLLHSGYAGAMGLFTIWDWSVFFDVAAFFVISGGPVGAVYGFASQKQMRDEEKQKRDKEEREAR